MHSYVHGPAPSRRALTHLRAPWGYGVGDEQMDAIVRVRRRREDSLSSRLGKSWFLRSIVFWSILSNRPALDDDIRSMSSLLQTFHNHAVCVCPLSCQIVLFRYPTRCRCFSKGKQSTNTNPPHLTGCTVWQRHFWLDALDLAHSFSGISYKIGEDVYIPSHTWPITSKSVFLVAILHRQIPTSSVVLYQNVCVEQSNR